MTASYVISVRQVSALLSVPSRHFLTEDALSVQLIVPLTGPIEDFLPTGRQVTSKILRPAGRT